MTWYEAAMLMLGLSLALMALGLPVAFSFIATNLVGAFVFMGGERGLEQVVSTYAASPPAEMGAAVLKAVEQHADAKRFADDLTILILKRAANA